MRQATSEAQAPLIPSDHHARANHSGQDETAENNGKVVGVGCVLFLGATVVTTIITLQVIKHQIAAD